MSVMGCCAILSLMWLPLNSLLLCLQSCFWPIQENSGSWKSMHSEAEGLLIWLLDPSKSPHYKIIFVSEVSGSESSHLIKIDIYSSETESGDLPRRAFTLPYDIGFYNAVYWNDAIYWLPSEG
ncbi:hypothetical protein M0R45_018823 [Rubus argutus]|uniref:Uncharacterized protein n=1 Tax=Rubus argutus TaxID=59490 RepID=A0AAW1X4Y2_RUBAR